MAVPVVHRERGRECALSALATDRPSLWTHRDGWSCGPPIMKVYGARLVAAQINARGRFAANLLGKGSLGLTPADKFAALALAPLSAQVAASNLGGHGQAGAGIGHTPHKGAQKPQERR